MLQSCRAQHLSQSLIRWEIVRALSAPPSVSPSQLAFLHPRRCPPLCIRSRRSFSTSLSSRDKQRPGGKREGKFVRNAPKRVRERGGDGSTRAWSPYKESGPSDLKSLADSLRGLAENMDDKITLSTIRKVKPDDLPESPLLRRMRKQRPHKRQVAPEESEPLANNLWAQMLASPIRCCTATKVRAPSDLMMPWGLMENPNDEKVYMMPRDVARLEQLRLGKDAVLAREEWAESETPSQVVEPAPSSDSEGDGSTQSTPAPTSSSRLMSPLSRFWMLPLRMMLRVFNRKLQKPLVARRLMPPRWLAAIDDDESRHRQLGEPAPVTPHWQADMDERLLSILQRRLLAAFEGFIRRQQRDAGTEAGIVKISVPDGNWSATAVQSTLTPREVEGVDDMVSGSMLLYVGSKPIYEMLTQELDTKQWSLRAEWDGTNTFQDSFAFPRTVKFAWQPSSASVPIQAKYATTTKHPLIAPTVGVKNVRLPVLPVLGLLTPAQAASLRDFLDPPESSSSFHPNATASDDASSQSYLILVPPAPPTHPAHLLMLEAYRLWRYVGGRHHVFPEKKNERYNDDLFHYRTDDKVIPASYSLWQTGLHEAMRGQVNQGADDDHANTVEESLIDESTSNRAAESKLNVTKTGAGEIKFHYEHIVPKTSTRIAHP